MVVKDHMYDSRIVDIKFHASINSGRAGGGQHVISSDRHIVKVSVAFLCCFGAGMVARWGSTAGQLQACTRPAWLRLGFATTTTSPLIHPHPQLWEADSGKGHTNIERCPNLNPNPFLALPCSRVHRHAEGATHIEPEQLALPSSVHLLYTCAGVGGRQRGGLYQH